MEKVLKHEYISPEALPIYIGHEGVLCMSGIEDLEENEGIW